MAVCVRKKVLPHWLRGAAIAALVIGAGVGRAEAQNNSATPFSNIPTAPSTLPVIGGQPAPDLTPHLVIAAAANDTGAVSGLLDAQSSPDEADDYGRTALIYAAMNNNPDMAQLLVNHGAKPNLRDNLGNTALHWAAQRGRVDVMRVLLDAKADVDAQNRQGLTPLMLAASDGQAAAVRVLLHYHADPTKEDYTGRDALSWAADHASIVEALKVAAAR